MGPGQRWEMGRFTKHECFWNWLISMVNVSNSQDESVYLCWGEVNLCTCVGGG